MKLTIAMTFLIVLAFTFLMGRQVGYWDIERLAKKDEFLRQAIHVAYEEGQKDLLIEVIDNVEVASAK